MDLIHQHQQEISQLCTTNGVRSLGVFGSIARNEADAHSDVDLLVSFTDDKSLFDLIELQEEFKKIFGRKVDLVTEQSVSPYIRKHIKNELKPIYART